jgi:hypothetical protein
LLVKEHDLRTAHHGVIDLLRQRAPKTRVHAGRRFIDNIRVI